MEKTLYYVFEIVLSLLSLACGLWCVRDPKGAIAFQQYFYSKINWRIEPVSWEKEIRNTKGMGVFLLLASLATLTVLFLAPPF